MRKELTFTAVAGSEKEMAGTLGGCDDDGDGLMGTASADEPQRLSARGRRSALRANCSRLDEWSVHQRTMRTTADEKVVSAAL
jgi:hypothetical protein